MKNAAIVAIAKGIKAAAVKKASGELAVGTHQVDTMVHIKGIIKKSEDEEAAPTVSLSVLETLALALKFSGVTGDAAKAVIRKTVTAALTSDSASKGALTSDYPWLADEVKALKTDVINGLPPITKSGKVTTSLVIEEAEDMFIRKLG